LEEKLRMQVVMQEILYVAGSEHTPEDIDSVPLSIAG
jgi:hypothetical protein